MRQHVPIAIVAAILCASAIAQLALQPRSWGIQPDQLSLFAPPDMGAHTQLDELVQVPFDSVEVVGGRPSSSGPAVQHISPGHTAPAGVELIVQQMAGFGFALGHLEND